MVRRITNEILGGEGLKMRYPVKELQGRRGAFHQNSYMGVSQSALQIRVESTLVFSPGL